MNYALRLSVALIGMVCCAAAGTLDLAAQDLSIAARQQLAQMNIPPTEEIFLANCVDRRTDIVDLFLQAGMKPDVDDDHGQTPLTHAAFAGHAEIMDRLLAAGAAVDHRDAHGATPLMYAASEGHAEIVARLLEAGADPNLTDDFHRWTPLLYAAYEGHVNIVDMLIEAGGDVNYQDPQGGFSALMYAAFQGYSTVVDRLLEADADADTKNILGETALNLAERRGFEQVTDLLDRRR